MTDIKKGDLVRIDAWYGYTGQTRLRDLIKL